MKNIKELLLRKGILAELEICRNEEEAINLLKRENLWGGVVDYPELETLKENYENDEIGTDGNLSLNQLDKVVGGQGHHLAAKARIAVAKKRKVRKPTIYRALSKTDSNEQQIQVKYEDDAVDSKELDEQLEVEKESSNIEQLYSLTEIESGQQSLFKFEIDTEKGMEKATEPESPVANAVSKSAVKVISEPVVENREKFEEIEETAETEDNAKPDSVEKEPTLEEKQKSEIEKAEENAPVAEPERSTTDVIESLDKITDKAIEENKEKHNEEIAVGQQMTYIEKTPESEDDTKVEIEKEKPVILKKTTKTESPVKDTIMYKKTPILEDIEAESERERFVSTNEHKAEMTNHAKTLANPLLPKTPKHAPAQQASTPKKPLPTKTPEGAPAQQASTPKKPLPTKTPKDASAQQASTPKKPLPTKTPEGAPAQQASTPKKPLPTKTPKDAPAQQQAPAPKKTLPTKTPEGASAQQAPTPKKPLPPDPYRAEASMNLFEKILSKKIAADDELCLDEELTLLVTGLHELVKSPVLREILYKTIGRLDSIVYVNENPSRCGMAYLNEYIFINQNIEDRTKIYILIHELFHCIDYRPDGYISKSFEADMFKDIKSLVQKVNGTYVLTEEGKGFLQAIKDIRSKPYAADLDVSVILDSIENIICCSFASVGCTDAIKSIFPDNFYISDANYPCFHSEFVANFGHALCIATSGCLAFLNFLLELFPNTTAIFEEKILGGKCVIKDVILKGLALAS